MRDSGLDKGLIRQGFDDSRREFRGQKEGFFGFRKMFRDYLTKLSVAFYDPCCPALTGDIFPVRFNAETDTLERFDGTDWVTLSGSEGIFDEVTTGDITMSEAGGIVASNMLVPFYPQGPQTDVAAGGGAILLDSYFTTINTDAGGDAFTLADGTVVGQMKRIRLLVDGGGDATITPANFVDTTITMNDAGDDVELMWDGVQWFTLVNLGATIA